MRRPTTLIPAGLAAAAILLLPACGGGSSDESEASSTPTSSSAAESSESGADADVVAFCAEGEAVFMQLEAAFAGASDPTVLPGLLQQAVGAFDQVQPPAELTADWETIRGGLESLRQTATTVDLATPEGQAQFGTAFGELSAQLAPAQANIEAYTTENCDTPSG